MTIQEALQILEISIPLHNLTENDIKKQYKKLAKKYHPDVNKSDDAEEMFKKINQAKEILEKAIKSKANAQNMFTMFEDLFSYQIIKSRINPVTVNVTLNLKEQYYGCQKDIKFKRRVICKVCQGSGCDLCHGNGFEIKEEKITIDIKPGVNSDSKLILKEIGHEYLYKSKTSNVNAVIAGDVIIKFYLDRIWYKNENIIFERVNDDLVIQHKIRYIDYLEKYHNNEFDHFEVQLFDDNDTVIFNKLDKRDYGIAYTKHNLGFKSDYRSIKRGNLIYIFNIDWNLDKNDAERVQELIAKKNVE